ncbi:MAG: hypothetical protein U0T81_01055 [Saprospiraceae bacterium]
MKESEWQDIKNKVDSVGFFALEDLYPVNEKEIIMDLPKTITTIFLNGRNKKNHEQSFCPATIERT